MHPGQKKAFSGGCQSERSPSVIIRRSSTCPADTSYSDNDFVRRRVLGPCAAVAPPDRAPRRLTPFLTLVCSGYHRRPRTATRLQYSSGVVLV